METADPSSGARNRAAGAAPAVCRAHDEGAVYRQGGEGRAAEGGNQVLRVPGGPPPRRLYEEGAHRAPECVPLLQRDALGR